MKEQTHVLGMCKKITMFLLYAISRFRANKKPAAHTTQVPRNEETNSEKERKKIDLMDFCVKHIWCC